jgi:hypothetical protein
MRQIVLAAENSSTAGLPDIVGRSEEEVGYHAHLLIGNGLAEGFSVRNMLHRLPFDFISDLTVAGHEFAELARDDDRWHAAITQAQGSGAVTLGILRNLLTHLPRQQAAPPNGKSGQETIHVIANKALTFLKDGYGGEQITVRPSNRPQSVPAWIRDTDTFRFAAKDGSVMEVEIKTPLPVHPTASNVAMVIRPYLEDRIAHWQVVYSAALPKVAASEHVPNAATTSSNAASTQSALAAKRQSIVMPILKQKRWSRGKLVTEAGIGKNSVYEYLDGKRNPVYANRKAMADALGLTEDQLPQ